MADFGILLWNRRHRKANCRQCCLKEVIIQDSAEFSACAVNSDSSINFVKVIEENYSDSVKKVEEENIKLIKGISLFKKYENKFGML
jgi:hypothetical protein